MAPVTFILCSGPSQNYADVQSIRKNRDHGDTVIAVNNMIFMAPWADVLYACDKDWWAEYGARVRDFKCRKVYLMDRAKNYGATEIYRCGRTTGLGEKLIHTGGNSGYQAINLAYIDGAREIVITGLDCAHTFGRRHCHDDHPEGMDNATPVKTWAERFPTIAEPLKAKGVRVVNCSRYTALTCFERMPLEDWFAARS